MQELTKTDRRNLTAAEFQGLPNVPPALEWFANINIPQTRHAYKNDVTKFSGFINLHSPDEMPLVTRAHVIAWREQLEARELSPSTICRKLSAISSLFNYLCEKNAVTHNPVTGVKRPTANTNEGSTPALSDAQARRLLDAPSTETKKGKRDRAIIATLLYHGMRREELCKLKVKDMQSREGVLHFRIDGKGSKIRYVPIQPMAQRLIAEYLMRPAIGMISLARSSDP